MRAGALRNLITIEYPEKTKGKFADSDVEWKQFKRVWASIETLNGRDKFNASASWPTASHKIVFRYIKGLLPTMRIVFENKIYSILGGINDVDMRHREIELVCESGVKAQ